MVQILGLKREIGIAFSLNGSIRLLKWNRNVIRNQCIWTCPDISTIPLHTSPLPPFCRSATPLPPIPHTHTLNKFLHLHHNQNSALGLGSNLQSCQPGHAAHAESTMEIKSARRRKQNKQEILVASHASHFHSLCAFNL